MCLKQIIAKDKPKRRFEFILNLSLSKSAIFAAQFFRYAVIRTGDYPEREVKITTAYGH
jgi:hypothetical protein